MIESSQKHMSTMDITIEANRIVAAFEFAVNGDNAVNCDFYGCEHKPYTPYVLIPAKK